jgi:ankyrin repeat protein
VSAIPSVASHAQLLQSTADTLFPGDADVVVALDSRASDGDSPLHVLLWRKDEAGARRLVDAGADVDAAGDLQDTPLHVAIRLKLAGAVAMLLAAGANADAPNLFGDTPRAAAYKQGGAMADCFRTAGLDPPPPSLPPVDAPE